MQQKQHMQEEVGAREEATMIQQQNQQTAAGGPQGAQRVTQDAQKTQASDISILPTPILKFWQGEPQEGPGGPRTAPRLF